MKSIRSVNKHARTSNVRSLLLDSLGKPDQKTTKKRSEEMQTLLAGCSKVVPKIFAPPQTPFPEAQDGQKFDQLEMVITFTYKPSLVKIDARNFELSW